MQTSSSDNPTPRNAVEMLLDTFASEQCYLPSGAHPLASPDDLPPRLQARARSLDPVSGWRAWTDDASFWFISGRLCTPPRAPADLLALEISFFNPEGQPVAAGEWALGQDGHWTLRRVIDSFDSPDRARAGAALPHKTPLKS